jgi:hypothetical protein
MRRLSLLVLALAITAQGQTLCFSAPASCPQNTAIFFSTEAAPQLPGHADLMIPSSYSGGVPLAPVPVYGGTTATGTYGGGSAGAVYGGNTASGVELPPIGHGSAPGGGVTVNTGFGPH